MVRTSLNTFLDKNILNKRKGFPGEAIVRTSLNTCLDKKMLNKPKGFQREAMVRTSLNTCLEKKMLNKRKGLVRTSLNTCLMKTKKPRVLEKQDRLSSLPNDLLCLILSKLSTKDSVCTSVLSKRWRNLWLQVPVLDLDFDDFGPDESVFLGFLDRFLQSNSNQNIERFNLIYDVEDHIQDDFMWRINKVIERRVCHLTVLNHYDGQEEEDFSVSMPLSLYSCATLVSLTLYRVAMEDDILRCNPGAKLVSLPCLKTMFLEGIVFNWSSILTTLISRCFALEDLTLIVHLDDYLENVKVRSQSLKSFKFHSLRREFDDDDSDDEIYDPENLCNAPDIVINAPRLEYMSISGYQPKSFEILSVGPFAKLNVDVWFYLKNHHTMIHDFLIGISTVREMIISARSLKFIHKYSKMRPLPQFSKLSRLDASLLESSWEFLATFLGCCLNLRSISMELDRLPEIEEIVLSPVPQCVLSSLEFVKIKTATIADTPRKRELVRLFLMNNCAVLKKLIISEP